MKYIFISEGENAWIVEADNQHAAIAKAVEEHNYQNGDMSDFYYGLDDGQIQIFPVEKEI